MTLYFNYFVINIKSMNYGIILKKSKIFVSYNNLCGYTKCT